MAQAELFRRLGLYVHQGFFDADECGQLCDEIRDSRLRPGPIRVEGDTYQVDEGFRRAGIADVSTASERWVVEKLRAVQPQLAAHFQQPLRDHQPPQFLCYSEGSFYRPHADRCPDPDAGPRANLRRVSLVVFLNPELPEPQPGCYCGGSLVFYGLLTGTAEGRHVGIPLTAQTGLAVAFPALLIHEVAPIAWGQRYSLACWYI